MCFEKKQEQITEYPLYLHEDEKGNTEIIGRRGRKVRRVETGSNVPESSLLPTGATAHQLLVTDGEGVAKWEDKAFVDEETETIYVDDLSVPTYADSWTIADYTIVSPPDVLIITFDGVEYEALADDAENGSSDKYRIYGDTSLSDFTNDYVWPVPPQGINGEMPFLLMINCSTGKMRLSAADYQATHTLKIHTTSVRQILPNAYLPTTVPVIQTAAVGQTVVVKAVDSEGTPTEWEAAEQFSGSWEDLSEKPFYEETQHHLLIDNAALNFEWDSGEDIDWTDPTVNEYYKFPKGTELHVTGYANGEAILDTVVIASDDGYAYFTDNSGEMITVRIRAYPKNTGGGYYIINTSGGMSGFLLFTHITVECDEKTLAPLDPKFIVLTSPNGTKYTLSVSDDGTLSATAAT